MVGGRRLHHISRHAKAKRRHHEHGNISITSSSTRQRINTHSSIEAESVGVSDLLLQTLRLRYYLNEQGYTIEDNVLSRDKESAILMKINGRAPSGKRMGNQKKALKIASDYLTLDHRVSSCHLKPSRWSIEIVMIQAGEKKLERLYMATLLTIQPLLNTLCMYLSAQKWLTNQKSASKILLPDSNGGLVCNKPRWRRTLQNRAYEAIKYHGESGGTGHRERLIVLCHTQGLNETGAQRFSLGQNKCTSVK